MRPAVRWGVFAVGVGLSVALSLLLNGFFLFLLVPFLLWPFGGSIHGGRGESPPRVCPRCGLRTDDPDVRFCPRDGAPLQ